jgi:hypothetical protein
VGLVAQNIKQNEVQDIANVEINPMDSKCKASDHNIEEGNKETHAVG